ncbi:UPF0715 family protein [Bacillus infantis]|uniref:UPF0715 family protein n=1 Tax=Bacillus infantis TaxID=324767 RepID=UPI001CD23005|nr:UPF0715 family protein [Bacillus infantis]
MNTRPIISFFSKSLICSTLSALCLSLLTILLVSTPSILGFIYLFLGFCVFYIIFATPIQYMNKKQDKFNLINLGTYILVALVITAVVFLLSGNTIFHKSFNFYLVSLAASSIFWLFDSLITDI